MAQKRKTTSARKKTVSRGTKPQVSRSRKKEQARREAAVKKEILFVVLLIVAALLFLSCWTGLAGDFGAYLAGLFEGLLGVGAMVLSPALIAYCLWAFPGRSQKAMVQKGIGAGLFVLSFSILGQLLSAGERRYSASLLVQAGLFFDMGGPLNGGLIGGLFGWGLRSAFGWGSYLIAFGMLVIGILLSTGRSFAALAADLMETYGRQQSRREEKRQVRAARLDERQAIRQRQEAQAEQKRQQREEKRMMRQEKKAGRGFFNILLEENPQPKPEPQKPEVAVEPEAAEHPEEKAAPKQRKETLIEVLGMPNRDRDVGQIREPAIHILTEHMPETAENESAVLGQTAPPNPITGEEKKQEPDLSQEEILSETPVAVMAKEAEANIEELAEPLNQTVQQEEVPQEMTKAPEEQDGLPDRQESLEESEKIAAPTAVPMPQNAQLSTTDGGAEKQEIPQRQPAAVVKKPYQFPPLDLLEKKPDGPSGDTREMLVANARKLEHTLQSFGVTATVTQISKGPTVTRYEVSPGEGVRVSKIANLADDLALSLAATGIRIEAPIPGKAAVGIEVPNREKQSVYLRTVLESETFQTYPSKLAFALGEDITGNAIVTDIGKMPHLLIAGATGSGKSVCINTLITSILYKATPDEVRLILVDPKVVELSIYNGIPHLLIPVVTDPKKAAGALNWAVKEMLNRYQKFAETSVRDLKGYNAAAKQRGEAPLPQIVIIIDELADLMMAAPGEVEDAICRLAQMARAAGLHLIIATQRPSVDVITGVIKANIPSRLAFAVSSGVDSRTILDTTGAEKLLGKGDMLFHPLWMNKPVRIQGAFVTDKEVESIVQFLKEEQTASYDETVLESIQAPVGQEGAPEEETDVLYDRAVDLAVEKGKASASMFQRQFRIGFSRAGRLMDELERNGIVGPEEGSKPRRVLMTKAQWTALRYPVQEEEGEEE